MHVINYDLPGSEYGGIHEYVHRIGRTARIGNVGMATTFYNDRNEDIAEALTKILVESACEIPDFLEQYKPEEDGKLVFDDDTDEEDDGQRDGFGAANGKTNDTSGGGGWGAEAETSGGAGWG